MKPSSNAFLSSVLLPALLSICLLNGCSDGPTAKTDTKEVETLFASADPVLKAPADEAVKALNGGNLLNGATALVAVAKAGAEKPLSDAQKNALINLGASIQMVMAEHGDKADLKVYQAIEDLMSALGTRDAVKVSTNPKAVLPSAPPKE